MLCLSLLFSMGTGVGVSAKTGTGELQTVPEGQALTEEKAAEPALPLGTAVEDAANGKADPEPAETVKTQEPDNIETIEPVSGDRVEEEPIPEEEAVPVSEDAVEPVGEGAPDGWFASQTEGGAVEWSQDEAGNYTASFSHEGEIYYDYTKNNFNSEPGYSVTIRSSVPNPEFSVAIAGGRNGNPTKVTVDASLEGKVFVNELTVVEDGSGKYSFIGFDKKQSEVIDEESFEIKKSSTPYVSGTKVYDGLDMYSDYYVGSYYLNFGDRTLTLQSGYSPAEIKAYSVSGSQLLTAQNVVVDLSSVADLAAAGSSDFIFETGGRKYWLSVGTTGGDPTLAENRSLSLNASEEGVVYAYESSDSEKREAKGRDGIQYALISSVGSSSGYGTFYYNLRWDSSYLYGDMFSLYVRSTGRRGDSQYYRVKRDGNQTGYSVGRSAFSSASVKMTEPVYFRPKYSDDQLISISGNGSQFDLTYRYGYRGYAVLYLAAVKKGMSADSIPEDCWKSEYYYDYTTQTFKTRLDQAVNESGEQEPIAAGQKYDIYGIYRDGFNHITGTPFLVCTSESGEFDQKRVNLEFWMNQFSYDDGMEEEPLIPSYEEVRYPEYYEEWDPAWKFTLRVYGSSYQDKVDGTYRIKAIRNSDPHYSDFLKQKDFDDPYGYEITGLYDDAEGWCIGEYTAAIYFEPNDQTNWLPAVGFDSFNIEPTYLNVSWKLKNDGEKIDRYYNMASGSSIGYDDIQFDFYGTTRKDEMGNHHLANDKFELQGRPEKFQVTVYKAEYMQDDGWGWYDYVKCGSIELTKGGESYTFTTDSGQPQEYGLEVEYDDSCFSIKNRKTGKADPTYALVTDGSWGSSRIVTVHPKGVVSTNRITNLQGYTPKLYYGMAQKLSDENATDFMKQLVSVTTSMTTGEKMEDVSDHSVYRFSTVSEGNFVKASGLDKSKLSAGTTLYVKGRYLGVDSTTEPVGFVIEKQPVAIQASAETIIDRYGALVTEYSGDIMVRDVTTAGCLWPLTYSEETNGSAPITDWSASSSIQLDTSGVNSAESGRQNARLKVVLKEDKSANYEVRSTGAIYIVRSGGAISIEEKDYEIVFENAGDHSRLAESQTIKKNAQNKKTEAIRTEKAVNAWYMEINDSGDVQNITGTSAVETVSSDGAYFHTFDIGKAIDRSTLNVSDVYRIAFFASFETEEKGGNNYIAVSPIPSVVYTGKAHVSVMDSSEKKNRDLCVSVYEYTGDTERTLLVEGVDYQLSYKNNINAADPSDAKAPEVTIKGKGAHKGLLIIRKFTILPMDLSGNAVASQIEVKPYYNFTSRGISAAPTVTCDSKKLKAGETKDYMAVLLDADTGKVVEASDYANHDAVKKFRLRIEGVKNYKGTLESDEFYGVPKNMKALSVKLKNKAVKWEEGKKESITKEDFFGTGNDSVIRNYKSAVSVNLYIYNAGKYTEIKSARDTGKAYYIGVMPASEADAVKEGIAPAPVYIKVNFNGLKFNKLLFKLSSAKVEYTGEKIGIKLQPKKENGVKWEYTKVYFGNYYREDGDRDVLFEGVDSPEVNNTENTKSKALNNDFPGTYSVIIDGEGCYSGTVTLTYKVLPMKAVLSGPKKNLEATVNGGNGVAYNAGGIDAAHAPVDLTYVGSRKIVLNGLDYDSTYKKSKKTGETEGAVVLNNIRDKKTGVKIFKNKITVPFRLLPSSLSEGINLWKSRGAAYGAIRPKAVDASVNAPRLYLEQYGGNGWVELDKTDFNVDELKSLLDTKKAVDVTINAESRTGARFEGSKVVVPVESYSQTWKKAKLNISLEKNEVEYTGNPVSANVIVKDGSSTVDPSNYVVEFQNNTELTQGKNQAKAIVTFVRPGAEGTEYKYGGTKTLTFKITRKYN